MMDAKKPLAKATVKPVAATKAEPAKPAAEEKKAEPAKAEAVKKAVAKKAATVRKTTKKAAAKVAEKKTAEKKTTGRKAAAGTIHVQYAGKSYTTEDLMNIMKDVWIYDLNQKEADLKNVELYVKPEENSVYYVVGEISGRFAI